MARQALGKGLDALIKQTQEAVNMPTEEVAQQMTSTDTKNCAQPLSAAPRI